MSKPILRFTTASGSTYVVDTGEGTVHRTNAKALRGVDGEPIPGNAWMLDKVVGILTPVGFLSIKDDASIGLIMPQGAMLPIVGHSKPIVTTGITSFDVEG